VPSGAIGTFSERSGDGFLIWALRLQGVFVSLARAAVMFTAVHDRLLMEQESGNRRTGMPVML
jgi:hypothetical protein